MKIIQAFKLFFSIKFKVYIHIDMFIILICIINFINKLLLLCIVYSNDLYKISIENKNK